MTEILESYIAIMKVLLIGLVIAIAGRKAIESWFRHSNPEGYRLWQERGARRQAVLLPWLIAGFALLFFAPCFSPILWGIAYYEAGKIK